MPVSRNFFGATIVTEKEIDYFFLAYFPKKLIYLEIATSVFLEGGVEVEFK